MVIARKRFLKLKANCCVIQAHFVAKRVRNTPIGKAIQRVVELQKDKTNLEFLVLRMVSISCPIRKVERTQIIIS